MPVYRHASGLTPREHAMAGQPPEPSWQPAGQDQTQARAAWPPPPSQQQAQPQQPSFTPQGGAAQDAYGYPQPPPPGYPPPPPGYAAPGQEQGYPGQEQQGYQGQEHTFVGQDQSQWQGVPGMPAGMPAGQPRAAGEKGFFGSLFDFSFSSFVTPKIIKVLYVLFTLWTALVALIILVVGFRTGGMAGGLFVLIVILPIYVLLTLGVYRVILEAFMVIFRIYEETKKISERTQNQV
jgi:Domain of unknown function (DUF4282)